MTMASLMIRVLMLSALAGVCVLALGLWHRAPPPPSSASLWLSGPEAALLMQTLGKQSHTHPPKTNDKAQTAKAFFFPPVRGNKEGLWDGLGILYPVEPLQPLYAPTGGEVLFNRFMADVGHVFMIRHDNQRISVITGMAKPPFQEGDTLKPNQILGVPETNTKTIFYMLRQNGKVVDPRKMFDTLDSPL
ncbi:MAG: peptidoglycan DD-metalloendopeptidase family protein [Alphaproteobacteria bacterium]